MTPPASQPTLTARIATLDGWRVLIVLGVALAHSGVHQATPVAWLGLVLFFMSSGFLMAARHGAEMGSVSLRDYWRGRMLPSAVRFYSVHWLVLALLLLMLVTLGANAGKYYWPALPLNVLLLHGWVPVKQYFYSFYFPSWYLGALLFCYACFPWLCRWLMRVPLGRLLAGTVAGWAAYAMLILATDGELFDWLHVLPVARLWDFALGIVAWRCYRVLSARRWPRWLVAVAEWGLLALTVALIATCLNVGGATMFKLNDSWLWEPVMLLVVLCCALGNGREGLLGRAVASRPLRWLAGLMIELYMLHGLAGLTYNYFVAPIFGHFGYTDAYNWYVWLQLPILVALAWAVHRWFSRPVARAAKKLAARQYRGQVVR